MSISHHTRTDLLKELCSLFGLALILTACLKPRVGATIATSTTISATAAAVATTPAPTYTGTSFLVSSTEILPAYPYPQPFIKESPGSPEPYIPPAIKKPPPSPTTTTTPFPHPELAGLVYQNYDGLWQVQVDGRARLLMDEPDACASVSPDNDQVLFTQDDDIWLMDLKDGARRNLTQTSDRFEWCPQWGPARPDIILFRSTDTLSLGIFRYGPSYLTSVQPDGSEYQILDPNHEIFGDAASSPHGRKIAYNGWIYDWDTHSVVSAIPEDFGLPDLEQYVLDGPSWSPDGWKIAWTISNPAGDFGYHQATAIFDYANRTAFAFHFLEPMGSDAPPPAPEWSPDGNWLAIDALAEPLEMSGIWIFPAGALPGDEFQLEYGSYVWSPDGQWLAISDFGVSSDTIVLYDTATWQRRELRLEGAAVVTQWLQMKF